MRKVGVLVEYLPAESATATAMRNDATPEEAAAAARFSDPTTAPWSMDQMLMAQVIDEVRLLRHTLVQVNSERNIGAPPDPIPRPGTKRKRQVMSPERRAALDPRISKG